MSTVFMRMIELEAYLGLRSATIYKYVREGRFPAPIKIGDSSRGVSVWRRDEVDAFVERLTAERDAHHSYNPSSVYSPSGRPRKKGADTVQAGEAAA